MSGFSSMELFWEREKKLAWEISPPIVIFRYFCQHFFSSGGEKIRKLVEMLLNSPPAFSAFHTEAEMMHLYLVISANDFGLMLEKYLSRHVHLKTWGIIQWVYLLDCVGW